MTIKQYWIWIGLLAKRLWRQPAYVGLLVLIPLIGYGVGAMESSGRSGAVVAVCVEDGAWSGQISGRMLEQEEESILHYAFYDDAAEVERCVARNEADCGFVIPGDVDERVTEHDWQGCITVYETSGSSIAGMAKERIGSIIFRLYSEDCYETYMEQFSEEIVDFASEAYRRHLVDNSTFGFQYVNGDQYSQTNTDTDVISDTTVFPVKGVFAVVIFVSGMCGMLEYDRDRREKRFVRMAPKILTYIVDIWMPTVFVSVAVLLCLWLSDILHYAGIMGAGDMGVKEAGMGSILSVWSLGMWCGQIMRLLLYQCVVVGYCGILGCVLRRQETIAAAIPILSLGSLLCAPVFIRLAVYFPIFAVLEKLFPVTYYLAL